MYLKKGFAETLKFALYKMTRNSDADDFIFPNMPPSLSDAFPVTQFVRTTIAVYCDVLQTSRTLFDTLLLYAQGVFQKKKKMLSEKF